MYKLVAKSELISNRNLLYLFNPKLQSQSGAVFKAKDSFTVSELWKLRQKELFRQGFQLYWMKDFCWNFDCSNKSPSIDMAGSSAERTPCREVFISHWRCINTWLLKELLIVALSIIDFKPNERTNFYKLDSATFLPRSKFSSTGCDNHRLRLSQAFRLNHKFFYVLLTRNILRHG